MDTHAATSDALWASLLAQSGIETEQMTLRGVFHAVCRDADDNVLWEEEFSNLVTTVGKNLLLDQSLAGSAYTAAEFMLIISSASFSAVAAGDTMASHAGWLEATGAQAPTYAGTRGTCAWSAASAGAKALSAALSFTFNGSGTVQGAAIVGGSGAVNTTGSTAGTLISAGTLTTPQPVISGNVLQLSYTLTLT